MLDVFDLTNRSAGDILSRVVRVTLGGTEYELPVRSIKANREWRDALDDSATGLIVGLAGSGNDLSAIYAALASQPDILIDALIAYDSSGVLPPKEEIEAIEPDCSADLVTAVKEVWRAANPLVVMSLAQMEETEDSPSSPDTSSPLPPTDTDLPATSRTN